MQIDRYAYGWEIHRKAIECWFVTVADFPQMNLYLELAVKFAVRYAAICYNNGDLFKRQF